MICMINIAKVTIFKYKLGCCCILMCVCLQILFLLYTKQTGQEIPILSKEGWMGEITSFASNKTQISELVGTPGRIIPPNFGHMISHGQEAYPVSLKQSRLITNDSIRGKKLHFAILHCQFSWKSEKIFWNYFWTNKWRIYGRSVE